MLRKAPNELENSVTKRVKTNEYAPPIINQHQPILFVTNVNQSEAKTITIEELTTPNLKRKESPFELVGFERTKKHKQESCFKPKTNKRKLDIVCDNYSPEKAYEDQQRPLNLLIKKVFCDTEYVNIDDAQVLLDFFKCHSLADLDLNFKINGASIFFHIIAAARNNGTLAPFVINKLCEENLLTQVDWNGVGDHPSCKGETPLLILCKGLYDKSLTKKLIKLICENVPETHFDNINRYLINGKRTTPLCFLEAKRDKILKEEKNEIEMYDCFQKLKI